MKILQETLEASLMEILADENSVGSLDELKATIAETIPDLAESTAESMLAKIKNDAAAGLKEKWEYQQQFEERLRKHWGKPLMLLDLFVSLATEAGDEFNKDFRDGAARSNDAKFKALTLLHARACQVASATLVLLRSGYSDDAHARWRALHEIAVVGTFIGEKGRAVAERYLLHDSVQRYRLALKHRRHAKALEEKPITGKEFEALKAERDKLVARFGTPFKEDYGWAASTLERNARPLRTSKSLLTWNTGGPTTGWQATMCMRMHTGPITGWAQVCDPVKSSLLVLAMRD